jgi:hypothetical protein
MLYYFWVLAYKTEHKTILAIGKKHRIKDIQIMKIL